jgi:hypothetical protein
MTDRRRLPNRRRSETFSFRWASMNFTATIARFDTGELAEPFLSNGRVDSNADTAARDSAVAASLALQFGVPLDVLRGALLRDSQDKASVVLGTALDLIAERQ